MLGHHFVEMKRNMNWPSLSNALKRRNIKDSSRDYDKDSTDSVHDQPASPSSSMRGSSERPSGLPSSSNLNVTPSSPSGRWSEHSASPQTASPTSPQSFTSRHTYRISSLIRGRHSHSSNALASDPDGAGIPHFMYPGVLVPSTVKKQQEQEYNSPSQPCAPESLSSALALGHQQQRMDSPNITPLSSSSTWPGADRSMATLFSPVSPPIPGGDVAIGSSTRSLSTQNPQRFGLPIPQTSHVAATASYTSAPAKADVDMEMETDFDSPSDFALFSEATSSLSFFPSDSFSAPNAALLPIPSSVAPTAPFLNASRSQNSYQRQTFPVLQPAASVSSLNQHFCNNLTTRSITGSSEPPRSRSVPPPMLQNNHYRSTSNPAPMPATGQQVHSSAQVQTPISRSRLIAEALAGLGNEGVEEEENSPQNSDEELPDYATSQAEASERQRVEAISRARQLEEGWLRGRAERIKRPWRAWERGSGM